MSQPKIVPLLLLFSWCFANCSHSQESHSQELSRDQYGIVVFLREGLANPSSYEPIKWVPVPYLAKDVNAREGYLLLNEVKGERASLKSFSVHQESVQRDLSSNKLALSQEEAFFKLEYKRRNHLVDSLQVAANNLLASTDTTCIGTVLYHVYRSKRRTGEVVTDTVGHILLAAKPGKAYLLTSFDTLTIARTKRLMKLKK